MLIHNTRKTLLYDLYSRPISEIGISEQTIASNICIYHSRTVIFILHWTYSCVTVRDICFLRKCIESKLFGYWSAFMLICVSYHMHRDDIPQVIFLYVMYFITNGFVLVRKHCAHKIISRGNNTILLRLSLHQHCIVLWHRYTDCQFYIVRRLRTLGK